MNVLEAIHTRRAVRLFSEQPVPQDVIEQILRAGMRAQSSKNTQPWLFIVVRERETLTALSTLGKFAGHVAGANFAICFVGTKQTTWNSFDLGQAAAQMQLAAHELGVGSCIAAMYDEAEAKALLGVPDDHNFFCVISFGYPAPEHQPLVMGGRKPLEESVRWESY
jgi:nitroreductase